jgi:L-ascorbate metabolism protein UlaG (beta-lactamase superfamily)
VVKRLKPYARWMLPAQRTLRPGAVRATFMGTSTILIRDDHTSLLVDGFFSRPSLLRVATRKISPNRKVIDACLARAGITSLDAVLCAHSHYDHAMDAPVIAAKFGAPLIGSPSTMNVGRGYGLRDGLLTEATDGQTFTFGAFAVTLVRSLHSHGDVAPGGIDAPLTPPARYRAWRTGECYSIFFRHPAGTLLIHASANYLPGTLAGHQADTAFLSIARLGRAPNEFRRAYWHETIGTTGARTVLPIHWDDFTKPLDRPLTPMPFFMDDFTTAMNFTISQSEHDGVTFALPTPFQEFDPFEVAR